MYEWVVIILIDMMSVYYNRGGGNGVAEYVQHFGVKAGVIWDIG